MNDRPFPHLNRIFAQHPERFEELIKQDENGFIRARAEAILARPAAQGVDGLEKLASDFASAWKFYNLCQEVLSTPVKVVRFSSIQIVRFLSVLFHRNRFRLV
ncbi:hypothetical protein IEI94_07010 [Halomonas sp. ML-15]|uniref:hypothetical protein n=1 Tax=Halomonas sp. ML-15 TaxID=2773305 RepID=UPI00174624F9|nr:hypothetical protein [Halomonas sp. ML-15]MBD3895599.1 hypothetical protein [Halomonas sp. ML-15]